MDILGCYCLVISLHHFKWSSWPGYTGVMLNTHTWHTSQTYVTTWILGNLIGIVFLRQTKLKQNESTQYPVNPVREVPRKEISKFIENWVVVSDICYFHHYLGKWSNLTCAYFSTGLVQPPNLKNESSCDSRFSKWWPVAWGLNFMTPSLKAPPVHIDVE